LKSRLTESNRQAVLAPDLLKEFPDVGFSISQPGKEELMSTILKLQTLTPEISGETDVIFSTASGVCPMEEGDFRIEIE